jgi:hypothetical protein
MKKLLLLVVAGAGAALAMKKNQDAQHELALWAEATDKVKKSSSGPQS